jgi:hypothetical protein
MGYFDRACSGCICALSTGAVQLCGRRCCVQRKSCRLRSARLGGQRNFHHQRWDDWNVNLSFQRRGRCVGLFRLLGTCIGDVTAVGLTAVTPDLKIIFSGFSTGPGVEIRGGAGADTLIGGDGDDVLIGGPGADILRGNSGTDRRGDTVLADCVGDTLDSIEIDSCVAAVAPVPTMAEWAMILLGTMMAGGAALTLHRRRQAT